MAASAFGEAATCHRMLEGFLRRMAAGADPDAFVLRGGMLVRHWFPDAGRQARDVDLVCRLPYDPDDLRRRLGSILADRRADGVVFDPDRIRLDRLWPDGAEPGLRLFATGEGDGRSADVTVDLTFGLDVWPAATREVLPLARGAACVWVCRHEMVVARKLRVTSQLGSGRWRPKDVADLWLLLRRGPTSRVLGEAIERVLSLHEIDALFDRPWWSEPHAAARWGRYARRGLPRSVGAAAGEIRAALRGRIGPGLAGRVSP